MINLNDLNLSPDMERQLGKPTLSKKNKTIIVLFVFIWISISAAILYLTGAKNNNIESVIDKIGSIKDQMDNLQFDKDYNKSMMICWDPMSNHFVINGTRY